MKVLVTGGAGIFGSHVVRMLEKAGHSALTLDNLSTVHRWVVPIGKLVAGNLSDVERQKDTVSLFQPDAVMHFAAYSQVEVIGMAKLVTGIDFSVEIAGRRPGDRPTVVADCTKITNRLGWTPKNDDNRTYRRDCMALGAKMA